MNQEKIGKFIAEMRKAKSLTQEQLAEKLSVNSRSISRWENGRCMPDLSLYESICNILDISINELLSGEKIIKDNYQETFERNVINLIDEVDKKTNIYNLVLKIIIFLISFSIIIFGTYTFYNDYYFVEKYDKYTMTIDDQDENFYYYQDIGYKSIGSIVKYYAKEKIDIIFVQSSHTLYQKNYSDNSYNSECRITIANKNDYESKKIKVYYTEISFNKIRNANTKELEQIIKKSNLIYEK